MTFPNRTTETRGYRALSPFRVSSRNACPLFPRLRLARRQGGQRHQLNVITRCINQRRVQTKITEACILCGWRPQGSVSLSHGRQGGERDEPLGCGSLGWREEGFPQRGDRRDERFNSHAPLGCAQLICLAFLLSYPMSLLLFSIQQARN
jgi:hypothetical protein